MLKTGDIVQKYDPLEPGKINKKKYVVMADSEKNHGIELVKLYGQGPPVNCATLVKFKYN